MYMYMYTVCIHVPVHLYLSISRCYVVTWCYTYIHVFHIAFASLFTNEHGHVGIIISISTVFGISRVHVY